MTVEAHMRRHRDLSTGLLFQIEQWMALVLGIACLAVFAWAALDGHEAFSIRHLPHFSATIVASTGWSLTVAAGLIGIALMRFAFYKKSEPEPDKKTQNKSLRIASGASTENSNELVSIDADKRGG